MSHPARKVAVVGGTRGIGAAITSTFVRGGHDVVLSGRAVPDGAVEKFRAEAARAEQTVKAVSLDSAAPDSAERLAEAVSSLLGGLDVLCLNAGVFPNKPLAELTYTDIREVFAVNVESQMLAVAACLPLLRESASGRVVLTSSITGPVTGFPGWSHYAASKAAQLGFMRTAALELAPYGITVNAVAPGNVATEGLDGMGDAYLAQMTATIPLGRLARPQEIADAVEFLASERAAFITGQVITVDGGQTLPESPDAVLPAETAETAVRS
ncbi:SDR family oxidoreductase [Streptomyces lincolnensis]|uniref:SDR family NAD(P)-dependent oxidoreductase n=1 Tax=Streptomyces lincolnensis TaxID=1915 RepID=UPI001E4C1EBD|nr:SDR family NAD(P)-dependent oxidoreductase [Streptomyces lincolnensis]MCD7445684.1 SDR family oxidoreductase [Streptomyces lincolnensis]